jgi:hypothetical protein
MAHDLMRSGGKSAGIMTPVERPVGGKGKSRKSSMKVLSKRKMRGRR